MLNFKDTLKKYAELAVSVGVNIQKNQTLVVNAPIECADFVRLVAEIAYDKGAKNVVVRWNDEKLSLIKYLKAPFETFKEFPEWEAKGLEELAKNNAAFLSIYAEDPELLKNVDPERISESIKSSSIALKKYRDYIMNSFVSWSVISIPTIGWAKKVFPNLSEKEAIEKLWENIFNIVRADKENPIEAWNTHLKNLNNKVQFLNERKFKKLYYKSKDTDLTIELPSKHLWAGGGEYNKTKTYFVANMPTEEVFTLPLKTGINGTVKSTKPLNYAGNLINNFSLTFKEGKIVDFTAEEGYDTLKKLIETDDGSHYLGEVALVPFESPISNSNIVFFNTLFDENASCHLAIGAAYPSCLEGGDTLNETELEENGANTSLTHVDFMIGSKDLEIIGETKDGEKIQIFKAGNWAF
ncbi:aminopeptidase [Haloimpatiens sp. FM7315]|uniref:aminopeptidase n=1 Tax=Haloimpatiens sp. FM7315 TaxID=3298609 RepID=UPI0035A3C19E